MVELLEAAAQNYAEAIKKYSGGGIFVAGLSGLGRIIQTCHRLKNSRCAEVLLNFGELYLTLIKKEFNGKKFPLQVYVDLQNCP